MTDAYIIDTVRTPVGRRNGGLAKVHPADLGAHSIKALMERTGVDPGAVEDVVFGNVDSIAAAAYEEAGLGPDDLNLAEVYDLSTALELDWMENIGLCKAGEAEKLLNDGDTTIGGRIPVNPSGGLACFGEAVPAQAIAQVCEVTWQLRGQAEGHQVEGATAGITVNQGLFGHGSSELLTT